MKGWWAPLAIVVGVGVSAHAQDQPSPITFRLECLEAGRTFRFTLGNSGAEYTNVVIGHLWANRSWTPDLRLEIQTDGATSTIYSPGKIGPERRAAGFVGRVDPIIVPLPPAASYMVDLSADLFGLAPPKDEFVMSALLEAKALGTLNSATEGLRSLKVWTGRLVSAPIRVPADCARVGRN
jgi:hypothetical protein